MEISGPPAAGKTALAMEIAGSIQFHGGEVEIKDPEHRIDQEYSAIYGVEMDKSHYSTPDLVPEVFKPIRAWKPNPTKEGAVCGQVVDGLAALSTTMDLKEDGDKMGMRRAKEFSEELRKTCGPIQHNNWLVCCTNQIREGPNGRKTPGGMGIPFYASLRLSVTLGYPKWKIERKMKFVGKEGKDKKEGVEVVQQVGVISDCRVIKSSLDEPFREAQIYLIWNYGLHDVMANLQYYKDMMALDAYLAVDRGFPTIERAVAYVEEYNKELELRNLVIDLWEKIRDKFHVERKPKVRW